nr:L-threonine 3-O-phosphate decarboxylase [Raoultella sp. NCTC 9187]
MALLKSAHGGNTREAAALLGIQPAQLLDFSANINPLGMPESLKCALIANLDRAERYPDVDYQQLHEALAEHHHIPPRGSSQAMAKPNLFFTVVSGLQPRQAMIVVPGFAEYRRALSAVDCAIREFALRKRTAGS